MFQYRNQELYAEGVRVSTIVKDVGTPAYIYSRTKLEENFKNFDNAFKKFPHIICYALKANSNLSIGRTLSRLGAGTDIVSGGELFRALKSGFLAKKIVFSGVGKTREEMRYALKSNILMFNVESVEELYVLDQVARSVGKKAPVALRVNPDVPADTHHHITTGTADNKFGIHRSTILKAYQTAKSLKNIEVKGIQAHIGSQITTTKPFVILLKAMLKYVDKLKKNGFNIRYMDLGGGLGISYKGEVPPTPAKLASAFEPHLKGRNLTLLFEPGRSLAGNAGILVTKVLYRKETTVKNFIIVDGAMNDLARPALYDAYHNIVPVTKNGSHKKSVDVVGPICESGDYFAKNREIEYPKYNDLLAIENAGAYGFTMSSQYNSRPRVPEILVHGKKWTIIRKREKFQDLIYGEK